MLRGQAEGNRLNPTFAEGVVILLLVHLMKPLNEGLDPVAGDFLRINRYA